MNTLTAFGIASAIAWVGLSARPAEASHRRHHGSMTTNEEMDGPPRACSDISVRFDDGDGVSAVQHLTLSLSEAPQLTIDSVTNGGAWIYGEDRPDYAIDVCKSAAEEETLGRISAELHGGKLTVRGSSVDDDWVAHVIVRAPVKAAVTLEAENGPIAVSGLSGAVKIAGVNGPVSVRNCTGSVHVDLANGPLSVSGDAGDVVAGSDNGPVSLKLSGSSWKSGHVEMKSSNGPIDIHVPSGFNSAIRVEASEHAPFHCSGDGCASAHKDWGDGYRSLSIGEGEPVIHLSTENGPVSVRTEAR